MRQSSHQGPVRINAIRISLRRAVQDLANRGGDGVRALLGDPVVRPGDPLHAPLARLRCAVRGGGAGLLRPRPGRS
jgi:hypothetical protein